MSLFPDERIYPSSALWPCSGVTLVSVSSTTDITELTLTFRLGRELNLTTNVITDLNVKFTLGCD